MVHQVAIAVVLPSKASIHASHMRKGVLREDATMRERMVGAGLLPFQVTESFKPDDYCTAKINEDQIVGKAQGRLKVIRGKHTGCLSVSALAALRLARKTVFSAYSWDDSNWKVLSSRAYYLGFVKISSFKHSLNTLPLTWTTAYCS